MDAENGYGHTPEEVAETIGQVADTGAVGASIEDYAATYGTGDLYDRVLSREEAAVTVANSLPFPFTLTARAECYLDTQTRSRNREGKPLSRSGRGLSICPRYQR